MLSFHPFGFAGSDAKLCSLLSSRYILLEVRGGEYHECQIGVLAAEVEVSALLINLLGVLDFTAAVCKWGGNTREVQSLIFQGEKSKV
jgi:hypothetical protein